MQSLFPNICDCITSNHNNQTTASSTNSAAFAQQKQKKDNSSSGFQGMYRDFTQICAGLSSSNVKGINSKLDSMLHYPLTTTKTLPTIYFSFLFYFSNFAKRHFGKFGPSWSTVIVLGWYFDVIDIVVAVSGHSTDCLEQQTVKKACTQIF